MGKKKYIKKGAEPFTKGDRAVQRKVPFHVMLSVLFMNYWGVIGLVSAVIGLFISFILFPWIDFVTPFNFGNDVIRARGAIIEKRGTGISIDDRVVSAYYFSYSHMGRNYTGVSYTSGGSYSVNDTVPVEIEPSDPRIARIENMDIKPVHFVFSVFIFMFPLPGLVLLIYICYKRIPYIGIMKNGVVTRGKLIRMEETGNVVNKKRMYEVYFKFNDESGGKYTATGTSFNIELLQDEPEERIIYDPGNPSKSIIVDAMPGVVRKFLSGINDKS